MLDFWKSLLHQLIENEYFDQEAESQHRRSTRIQEGIGHGLMSVPPYENILGSRDRIPSTTPGAEPPRDARDSGSARSHSTHLETSSSDRP